MVANFFHFDAPLVEHPATSEDVCEIGVGVRIRICFSPPARFLQPARRSVKGDLLFPDSLRGVQ